jgi:hypothetical protein
VARGLTPGADGGVSWRGVGLALVLSAAAAGLTLVSLFASRPHEFLQPAYVWPVHLTIGADAYAAMAPRDVGFRTGSFWLQGRDGSRNGLAAARGIELDYVRGAVEIGSQRFADVAVRYKGNGTLLHARAPKYSFKIDLDRYVTGQRLAGQATINLHNEVTDAGWMNETLSYRIFRDAGVAAPRTSYARVFLTVPEQFDRAYLGLYGIVENVDANFMQDRFGMRAGAIFKPVTDQVFTYLGDDWARYRQTYDPKTDLTPAQKARVIAFSRFLSYASDEAFAAGVGDYIDLDNFTRYMAVVSWSGNSDSILMNGQNYYLLLNEAGRFSFVPWDQDHAFGTFHTGPPIRDMLRPWLTNDVFFRRMFGVDAVRTAYVRRLTEFSRTIFNPARLQAGIDDLAPVLRGPIVEEGRADQVARFDASVAGRPYLREDGTRVLPLVPFAVARTAELGRQLAARATAQMDSTRDPAVDP